jgi:4-amino-4-deoxy-L-arabinose transferase-like glycosyltransferase
LNCNYFNSMNNRTPFLLLVIATLLCLVPFLGKAFNIDDPLFIWSAQHIHTHPFDFYGFSINWYGTEESAAEIIKNPPFASYYIAVAGLIGGWSEISLHLAFLLPAVAGVLGTYLLARELSHYPLTAALMSLLTPVYILSSTMVMCDTMMLAMYVWALFLWIRGMRRDSPGDLLCASLLIALCSLTKYFGISLVPLLFLYTVCSKQGRKQRILFLLVPVVALCCYQWGTRIIYGRGLLLDAASYATSFKEHGLKDVFTSTVTGLSFLGGCLIPTLLFMPLLWGRRVVLMGIGLFPLLALGLYLLAFPEFTKSVSWNYYLQLSLYMIAGLHLLALAVRDLSEKRDPESLLLFLWVMGTFAFASFVNWSVNGRSILPLTPATGILIVRALGRRGYGLDEMSSLRAKSFAVPLTCAWLISMMIAWADYGLAGSARSAAQEIAQKYHDGKPLIFQGHWGFQYYMEQKGAMAFDAKKSYAAPATMAVPENNVSIFPEIVKQGSPLQILEMAPSPFLTTMNPDIRAGFYSSVWGELPFAFGNVPDEKYTVLQF